MNGALWRCLWGERQPGGSCASSLRLRWAVTSIRHGWHGGCTMVPDVVHVAFVAPCHPSPTITWYRRPHRLQHVEGERLRADLAPRREGTPISSHWRRSWAACARHSYARLSPTRVATELCGFSYSTFRKKRLPRPVPSADPQAVRRQRPLAARHSACWPRTRKRPIHGEGASRHKRPGRTRRTPHRRAAPSDAYRKEGLPYGAGPIMRRRFCFAQSWWHPRAAFPRRLQRRVH